MANGPYGPPTSASGTVSATSSKMSTTVATEMAAWSRSVHDLPAAAPSDWMPRTSTWGRTGGRKRRSDGASGPPGAAGAVPSGAVKGFGRSVRPLSVDRQGTVSG